MKTKLFMKYVDENGNVRTRVNGAKLREYAFVASIVTWPLFLWVVFWLGGNLRRISLAFQMYNQETAAFEVLPWSDFFRNFKRFFTMFSGQEGMGAMLGRSALMMVISEAMAIPNIFVAFCLFKKVYGSEFFKVVLYLPGIISGAAWILIKKNFIEYGLPEIVSWFGGSMEVSLFMRNDTLFPTLIALSIWSGFGGGFILYTGTMSSRVSQELIEAGLIDGMTIFRELWHLCLPAVYPLFTIGLFTCWVNLFTSDPGLFGYFGTNAPSDAWTLGYYFMKIAYGESSNPINFPYAAACSILFTLFAAPMSFGTRALLEKIGPSED